MAQLSNIDVNQKCSVLSETIARTIVLLYLQNSHFKPPTVGRYPAFTSGCFENVVIVFTIFFACR